MVSNKLNHKKFQRGAASLTDLLLTGTILIGLIGFVFVTYSYAWPYFQAWRTTTVTMANMQNINSNYASAQNFASLTTATIAQRNIVNDKFLPGDGTINNYYNGTSTVAPATLNGVTNNTQEWTDNGVPRKACAYHVNLVADSVDTISVGATLVKAFGQPVNTANLITACNSADLLAITAGKIKQS